MAVFQPVLIDFSVRSGDDYGLTAAALGASDYSPITGSKSPPGASRRIQATTRSGSRRPRRINCGGPCGGSVPSGLTTTPFMTNPTSCGPADGRLRSHRLPARRAALHRLRTIARHHRLRQGPLRPDHRHRANDLEVRLEQRHGRPLRHRPGRDAPRQHPGAVPPQEGSRDPARGHGLNPAAADGLGSLQRGPDRPHIRPRSTRPEPTLPRRLEDRLGRDRHAAARRPDEGIGLSAKQDDNPFDSTCSRSTSSPRARALRSSSRARSSPTPTRASSRPPSPTTRSCRSRTSSCASRAAPRRPGRPADLRHIRPQHRADPLVGRRSRDPDQLLHHRQGPRRRRLPGGDAASPADARRPPLRPEDERGRRSARSRAPSPRSVFNLKRARRQPGDPRHRRQPARGRDREARAASRAARTAPPTPASARSPRRSAPPVVGAGAGPYPFYIQGADAGKVFLTDGYKGAPLGHADPGPGQGRPLRSRHGQRPRRRSTSIRPQRSSTRQVRPDPPDPQGHPPAGPRHADQDRPPGLHRRADRLLAQAGRRRSALGVNGGVARSGQPLPGRQTAPAWTSARRSASRPTTPTPPATPITRRWIRRWI